MRRTLRTIVIGALVVMMSINPASAWHMFRGGCGGHRSYGPGYYSSSCHYGGGYGGGYYGSCGYAPLSYYDSYNTYHRGGCGGYGYSGECDGCGYGDGCSGGYGYSEGCGCGDEVIEGSVVEGRVVETAPEPAPEGPADDSAEAGTMPSPERRCAADGHDARPDASD